MNNLFKKISGLALGLALTLGAGISAFTVGNGAVKADAAEEWKTISIIDDFTLGEKAYNEKATINGEANKSVLKFGTSSLAGDASVTLPAGTTKIKLTAVSWKGKSCTLNINNGDSTLGTITPASNDGATGNAPYTITTADSDIYEISFSALSVSSTIKFQTIKSQPRCIIWNVQYLSSSEGGTTPTPDPEEPETPEEPTVTYEEYTIAEAKALEVGKGVILTGKIQSIDTAYSSTYDNISVTIKDDTDSIKVYRLIGGSDLSLGDKIKVTGILAENNSAKQIGEKATYELLEKGEVVYQELTISEALKAAVGTPAIVTGIVARVDEAWNDYYGNITVTITDETFDTIKLYRLATKVALGDKIKVTGVIAAHSGVNQVGAGATAEILSTGNEIPQKPEQELPTVNIEDAVATFALGANGSASHNDGTEATSYSETVDEYTLAIENGSKVYKGARDAKGNSCLKLGTGSVVSSFSITVPDNISMIAFEIAGYKSNVAKISLNNGDAIEVTTYSNNGEYTLIGFDTTTTKTVNLKTLSGGYRAMINTIYYIGTNSGGATPEPELSALDQFVKEYLHMDDIATSNTADTGACRGNNGYYALAIAAFEELELADRKTFVTDAKYADAYARLTAWATANGEIFNATEYTFDPKPSASGLIIKAMNENNSYVIIIIAGLVAASALVAYLVINNKRKNSK